MNAPVPEAPAVFICPLELMKFTLTFDGELPSSGNKPKPEHKWQIRHQIHPQLYELWMTHPTLKAISMESAWIPKKGTFSRIEMHHSVSPGAIRPAPDHMNLCAPIKDRGRKFLPLVRDSLALICGLDILFLRKEEPGKLIKQGGDIDNRLKTLFDGLKMPSKDDDLPDDLDEPFCCLLQEDALISDVAVRTGQLLTKPGSSVHEVRLVIDVTVKVTHVRSYNLALIGD
jgi:hypothetical protein